MLSISRVFSIYGNRGLAPRRRRPPPRRAPARTAARAALVARRAFGAERGQPRLAVADREWRSEPDSVGARPPRGGSRFDRFTPPRRLEADAPALVARADQPEFIDPATGFRRRSVSPPSLEFDCEVLRCELPAGASIDYPLPPRLGLEHHLYLEDGALELSIEGRVHRLSAGDCLRYKLVGASRFHAVGRRPARYILVLR